MFFLFPVIIFGLTLAGPIALGVVLIPIVVLVILIIIINVVQSYKPSILPKILKDWTFLPKPLRSLEPIDNLITSLFKYCKVSAGTLTSNGTSDAAEMQMEPQMNRGFENEV